MVLSVSAEFQIHLPLALIIPTGVFIHIPSIDKYAPLYLFSYIYQLITLLCHRRMSTLLEAQLDAGHPHTQIKEVCPSLYL